MTLEDGAATASDAMILEGHNLSETQMAATLGIRELGVPSGAAAVTVTPTEITSEEGGRRWVLTVEASGLEGEISQQRYLAIRLGDLVATFPYQLANTPSGTFTWTITGPHAEVGLGTDGAIDIAIAVTGRPATGVVLMQADLVGDETHALVSGGWELCDAGDVCSPATELAFDANSANGLKLKPAKPLVGKYTGSITIGSDQDPAGQTIAFTVYGTSLVLQSLGVLVVLLGVIAAWLTSTWAQNRINRSELLRPLIALSDRASALAARLAKLPAPISAHVQTTRTQLAVLTGRSMIEEFDRNRLLPANFPVPGAGGEAWADEYKTALAARVERCSIIEFILDAGLEPLVAFNTGENAPAIGAAAATIDMQSAMAKSLDDAKAVIDVEIGAFSVAASVTDTPVPTLADLALDVKRTSIVFWIVFGLLATALGSYVVVFSNAGFGLWTDFLFCLFWGFGLPVTATQAGQATMSTVGTALSVPVPQSS
ncbi:hypothetical protein [Devosia sp.]|uniref:hypothetical protein n=1 Tax=Devosia sp. TaxID=1871048 RepID=UPI002615C9BF|nr:hypothetical protein [Devosia sp.]